jgi:hypothetical protein
MITILSSILNMYIYLKFKLDFMVLVGLGFG